MRMRDWFKLILLALAGSCFAIPFTTAFVMVLVVSFGHRQFSNPFQTETMVFNWITTLFIIMSYSAISAFCWWRFVHIIRARGKPMPLISPIN